MEELFRHCDSYIRDKTQSVCLRRFLLYSRIPALWQAKHWKWGEPVLFATLKTSGATSIEPGTRVKITMASRFGDVGITTDLSSKSGYQARVPLEWLVDFSGET